jgi:hypothetical protein
VVTTGAGAPRDSWFSPKIEVRTSSVEGRGSFAVQRIDPGEVVEVWGERSEGKLVVTYTTDRGLAERARAKGKDVKQWDDDLYGIEDRGADEGYFLSHSCDSNLWFKDAFSLLARRGAEPGEELTIDGFGYGPGPGAVAVGPIWRNVPLSAANRKCRDVKWPLAQLGLQSLAEVTTSDGELNSGYGSSPVP